MIEGSPIKKEQGNSCIFRCWKCPKVYTDTVDGTNSAPPGMYKALYINTGNYQPQLVPAKSEPSTGVVGMTESLETTWNGNKLNKCLFLLYISPISIAFPRILSKSFLLPTYWFYAILDSFLSEQDKSIDMSGITIYAQYIKETPINWCSKWGQMLLMSNPGGQPIPRFLEVFLLFIFADDCRSSTSCSAWRNRSLRPFRAWLRRRPKGL